MTIVNCKICKKEFYAKPNWLNRGWGKYCSRNCQFKAQTKGKFIECAICGKKAWRAPADLKNSKSGKYFCSKSHQTLWRNKIYSGSRHPFWAGGTTTYRNILKEKGIIPICKQCGYKNEEVLVVHHKDKNRDNNNIRNLEWLCRNCHYLIHGRKTI